MLLSHFLEKSHCSLQYCNLVMRKRWEVKRNRLPAVRKKKGNFQQYEWAQHSKKRWCTAIQSTICFACAVATWQFILRFFYLNPTKASKERLPQNPMETKKAETAQNIPPRRFQLGTPESLQKPNQRPCGLFGLYNGEGWEGWEKLDILWSSWHFFGVEYVFLPGFLHTSRAFLFNSMDLCQDLERSTSKWHLLVWGPGYGSMYQDSVHEATTFWRFPWKTKIRSHPRKNRLIVIFAWNDYTSIPD